MTFVLASSSPVRRQMLVNAGVDFEVVPASIDESAEKARRGDPSAIAIALAEAKALAVSRDRPADWVAGSDSVVTVAGGMFDKPETREQAAEHLRFFSGKEMVLTSAVAVAKAASIDWSFCDSAALKVRPLSDSFIESYLDAEWPDVGYCVGVFRLEGRGVQLFDAIDGSFFTILGMPLLPLLDALRHRGVIDQ